MSQATIEPTAAVIETRALGKVYSPGTEADTVRRIVELASQGHHGLLIHAPTAKESDRVMEALHGANISYGQTTVVEPTGAAERTPGSFRTASRVPAGRPPRAGALNRYWASVPVRVSCAVAARTVVCVRA